MNGFLGWLIDSLIKLAGQSADEGLSTGFARERMKQLIAAARGFSDGGGLDERRGEESTLSLLGAKRPVE